MHFLPDEWHGLYILVMKLAVTSDVNPGTASRPHIWKLNSSRLAAASRPIPSLDLDNYVNEGHNIYYGYCFPLIIPYSIHATLDLEKTLLPK